ncbi:MAG: serine/threonine protein kinase [Candidatus Wallbacteria bacterium]|nr:serine/threonine protein kinase [Candidatus Wallbacteria bacterium]
MSTHQAQHVANETVRQALELPGYTILEPIATGASATVYKAFDERRGGLVALKVLERSLFDGDHAIRRFLREVRMQEQLEHPCILTLLDAGFLETLPYIVTELAAGGSLRQRMRAVAEPPLRFVWGTAGRVARGLEHAHGKQIVHRDLKPENVLFRGQANAALADFGLSKALAREHSVLTEAGTLLGTPSYIAPESIEDSEVTPAVDVYALGVLLFELLTGGPPFAAADLMELLHEKMHGEIPPLAMLRPDVSAAGRALVEACLERKPQRRPTAAEAAGALERLLAS